MAAALEGSGPAAPPAAKEAKSRQPARWRRTWARPPVRLVPLVFFRYAPVLILLLAWEAAPRIGLVNPQVLPSLGAVLHAWVRLFRSDNLLRATVASITNLCAGLGLGIGVGVALGVATAWWPALEALTSPLVKSLYPMPKSALIPVMILWFGMGSESIIASIFMGSLLPVAMSAYNGARGVDRTLAWSARALGARPGAVMRDIVLPSAIPDILAGVRTALGISFIIMVAAEFLFGQSGLGYLISLLGDDGAYPGMFAAILTVSIIGFFADRLYLILMRRILLWRD